MLRYVSNPLDLNTETNLYVVNKFVWGTAISVLIAVLTSNQAQAVTLTEIGDAGESLSTAQIIPSGLLPLESISGKISQATPDADIFQIFLTEGKLFSATTAINPGTLADPQLYLFDSSGKGIFANDNESSNSTQATLPIGGFSPNQSGIYYLAISGFDYYPVSAGGDIFPRFPEVSFDGVGVYSPTGAGGGSPLSEFDGLRLNGGSYTITLTGVQTSIAAVPESSFGLGILTSGFLSTAALLRKKKKQESVS